MYYSEKTNWVNILKNHEFGEEKKEENTSSKSKLRERVKVGWYIFAFGCVQIRYDTKNGKDKKKDEKRKKKSELNSISI